MRQLTVIASVLAILAVGCADAAPPSQRPEGSGPVVLASPLLRVPPPEPTATPEATRNPSADPTPKPRPKPTPLPIPPKPTGVDFHQHAREDDDGQHAIIRQRVTWDAPRTDGVEIRVYGVTKCLAEPVPLPSGPASGPCLVKNTPLPTSVRTLLATAPASDGVARWRWREWSGCNIGLEYDPEGPAYHAIVLAAYNDAGHSIFAIAEPGAWIVFAPDEVVC